MLSETAPAKINLFLHVLGRREDGYHLLESLVGFADLGDQLTLTPGQGLSLAIEGEFAEGLRDEADNLVLRAARAFAAHVPHTRLGHFRLTKNLPLASGIGGGSSDAAAALRLLARANGLTVDDPRIMACARVLGADVPVCLDPVPRLMRGIGHELGPALRATMRPALLVNPGAMVPTGPVFAALGLEPGERRRDTGGERNDLQPAAVALAPVIGMVLEKLAAQPGVEVSRMSGSGATCFALFDAVATRDAAARALASDACAMKTPRWWIAPCRINLPA